MKKNETGVFSNLCKRVIIIISKVRWKIIIIIIIRRDICAVIISENRLMCKTREIPASLYSGLSAFAVCTRRTKNNGRTSSPKKIDAQRPLSSFSTSRIHTWIKFTHAVRKSLFTCYTNGDCDDCSYNNYKRDFSWHDTIEKIPFNDILCMKFPGLN